MMLADSLCASRWKERAREEVLFNDFSKHSEFRQRFMVSKTMLCINSSL